MSVMCEDVAEQEMLFAYKFCRLTTVFVKAMKELHLTEKKMKKLTDDNIKLASELRTVISDYDLFVQRFPITKLFCIGQHSDIRNVAANVGSKYACSLANVPEWSAEAKVLADMILDMWQSDCENVANVATSIDVSAWQLVLPNVLDDKNKQMREAMLKIADADRLPKAAALLAQWRKRLKVSSK